MKPQIKDVPATTFLVANYPETRVPQIPEIAGTDIAPLAEAATAAGFEIAGDPTFFYFDCDGSPDTPFHFAIGLPVTGGGTTPSPYELREAPAYRCMAADYIGGMPNIKEGWHAVYEAVQAQGLQPGAEAREIYKHWVTFESEQNVTEIQVGLV